MDKKIEAAIRETLVVTNNQSIHLAVEKIMKIIAKESGVPKADAGTFY